MTPYSTDFTWVQFLSWIVLIPLVMLAVVAWMGAGVDPQHPIHRITLPAPLQRILNGLMAGFAFHETMSFILYSFFHLEGFKPNGIIRNVSFVPILLLFVTIRILFPKKTVKTRRLYTTRRGRK